MDSNSNLNVLGTNKIFFPNLNGIRFLAALMVIINHTEEAKIKIGFPTSYRNDGELGALGVSLFFVLSGFLITYLLQSEKSNSGTISLRNFYTRRALRIWPLYYLTIILGFWILPNFIPALGDEYIRRDLSKYSTVQLLLDIFFMPNVTTILFYHIPFLAQIWSIGVEEQFYLLWPVLLKYFKNILKPLVTVIIIIVVFRYIFGSAHYYLNQKTGTTPDLLRMLYFGARYLILTRIDCMAVGGFGAWLLFNKKNKVLDILYSKLAQLTTYLLLIVLIAKGTNFGCFVHIPYSILFIIIILNLSSNAFSIISLNNGVFNYLGKISYGIYMFHPIAIAVSVKLILSKHYVHFSKYISTDAQLISVNIILYLLIICIVVAISTLSYSYFEKYFLAKKLRFSTIISGDNVDVNPRLQA